MTSEHSDLQARLDECQRALQASEARFASVMAHAAHGVMVVDEAGSVVYANPAAERLFTEPDQPRIGSRLPLPLEPGEHEVELAPPGGPRRQVSVHVTAIEWDGAPARMLSLHDVTRWRRAEAYAAALAGLGLRLAEARTREEAAQVVLDTADRLLGWDSCWLDVYAPEPDAVITVMQMDVVDGERRSVAGTGTAPPSVIFRQVVEAGALLIDRGIEAEAGLHLKPIGDTTRRSACLMFVPMRHHGVVNGVVSIQSYTPGAYTQEDLETLQALADHCAGAFERLHSEAARREGEERFRALIENSSDAIAVLDPQGVMLYASPATTALTGYAPHELVGAHGLERLGARKAALLREQLGRLAREPGSRAEGTMRLRHKDSSVRWIEGVLTNLLHVPSVRGIVANYRDVTARQAAEAALRRRNQELLALNRIGQALAQLAEPAETSRLVHHWLGLVLDNRNFYVALYDVERQYLDFPFYTIEGRRRPPGGRAAANGITEYVLRTREPLLVGHDMEAALAERGIEPVGQPARSLLAVPMLLGSDAIGVLALQDYANEHAYDEHARDLLVTVAAQAAVAFANARLYAAVQQELEERRRAEAALRDSETRYRQVTEIASDYAYCFRLDGPRAEVEWVTEAYQRITGYSTQAMGRPGAWRQVVHPDDLAIVEDHRRHLFAGEAHECEYRIITREGQQRWLRDTCRPARDSAGGPRRMYGAARDITDRKRFELNLAEAEARYRTLVEQLPAIIYVVAPEASHGSAYISPQVESLLGYTPEEWQADPWLWQQRLHPEDREVVLAAVRAADQARQPLDIEYRMLARDGRVVWFRNRTVPLHSGGAYQVLGLMFDITERAEAEAALRRSEARLRSVLAQAQAHAEQLAAINALGRVLAETLELPQIYEHLYEATSQLLPNLATVILALYDEEQAHLAPVFGVHGGVPIDTAQLPPAALEPPGQGTQSEAVHTRRPFIINDLPAWHQQHGKGQRLGSGPDTLSALYVPLLAKGRVVGVLQAQANERDRFSEAEAALLSLAANTAAIAIENARLFAETERRLQHMQALHDIHRAITSSLDLRVTLNVLLDQATAQLDVDAAAVLLFNPHMQTLDYAAGRGFRTKAIERSHLRLGEGIAGRAALERRTVGVPNLAEAAPPLTRSSLLAAEGFRAYWAVPLIAKGEVKGVLDIFHRSRLQPTAEWLEFLQTVASQAALAIDNTSLFNSLQRANIELTLAYEATIEGWARALDLRVHDTPGRSQRVTRLTESLARRLGMAEHDMAHVRRGAWLHDIGTLGVPESILLKPGPLTADEWAVVRQHPTLAYELLSPIAPLRPALDIPYCHHERWDGTGYPRGLRGEQIPLAARLFAVVDVWDALSSDRPFRPAWPAAQVQAYLREQAGRQFDPRCVEAFLDLIELEHGPAGGT